MIEFLNDIDVQLFRFFNQFHSPFFDTLMYQITLSKTWIPFYLIMMYILYKKMGLKGLLLSIVFIALTVTLCDQISTKGFKYEFKRFRPSHQDIFDDTIHLIRKCKTSILGISWNYADNSDLLCDFYRGGKYGFVSSHATNTFGIATIISLLYKNKRMTYLLFFWALVVSYSRIYIGVHFPFDILCGAILGCLLGGFSYWLYKLVNQKVIV